MVATSVQHPTRQRGATLIEIVMAVAIITIAVGAVVGVLAANGKQSADAMVREQAIAIGNAYLEEIMLKSFDDPDGTSGEASRLLYDDVSDYNGLNDTGARDQFGTVVLNNYIVQVTVTPQTLSGATAKRIDVTVLYGASIQSGASQTAFKLTAYRTDS